MTFLKNAWYAAGWASDLVQGQLLGRTFLNEPVVMFRKTDGTPAAISDLCPHRFAPLHMGKQIGDIIQCGYHGLEFNAEGRCVRNPHGNGKAVPGAIARSYPLIERYNLLWIWVGDERADDSLIPDYSYLVDPQRGLVKGTLYVNANYLLIADNLLDPAHALYLHLDILVTEEMRDNYYPKAEIRDDVVTSFLFKNSITPPPLVADAVDSSIAKVDLHDTTISFVPPNVQHDVAYSRVGEQPYTEGGVSFRSAHLFTPETEKTSHYFYAHSRDYQVDSAEVQEGLEVTLRRVFTTQDIPMIEAQQRLIGDRELMDMRPALIDTDKASVLMRRRLDKLIAEEARKPAAMPRAVTAA